MIPYLFGESCHCLYPCQLKGDMKDARTHKNGSAGISIQSFMTPPCILSSILSASQDQFMLRVHCSLCFVDTDIQSTPVKSINYTSVAFFFVLCLESALHGDQGPAWYRQLWGWKSEKFLVSHWKRILAFTYFMDMCPRI